MNRCQIPDLTSSVADTNQLQSFEAKLLYELVCLSLIQGCKLFLFLVLFFWLSSGLSVRLALSLSDKYLAPIDSLSKLSRSQSIQLHTVENIPGGFYCQVLFFSAGLIIWILTLHFFPWHFSIF